MDLIEDVIAVLSNLGAINEKGAVDLKILSNSGQLRGVDLEKELKELESRGYIVRRDEMIHLTETGLFRALSGRS